MSTIQEALRQQDGPLEPLDSGWARTYTFAPDFPAFAGHFPNHPVLPAVAQIALALRVIAQAVGMEPVLLEIRQAKFMSPVLPERPVRVAVRPESGTCPEASPNAPGGLPKAPPSLWVCTLTCDNVKTSHCRLLLEFL